MSPLGTAFNAWSEERIEALKQMVAAGKTAKVMAADLRITRNAVIGKIKRLKLEWSRANFNCSGALQRAQSAARPKRESPKKADRPPSNFVPWVKLPKREEDSEVAPTAEQNEATALPSEAAPETRVTLLGLTATTCRWPLGEDRVEFFCGDEIAHGRVYCPHHCRMAFVKPSDRRRAA